MATADVRNSTVCFHHHPQPPRESPSDDENEQAATPSPASLRTPPPGCLALEVYRENPERHFEPLCTAVAAVVLGDSLRWEEVQKMSRGSWPGTPESHTPIKARRTTVPSPPQHRYQRRKGRSVARGPTCLSRWTCAR